MPECRMPSRRSREKETKQKTLQKTSQTCFTQNNSPKRTRMPKQTRTPFLQLHTQERCFYDAFSKVDLEQKLFSTPLVFHKTLLS